MALLKIILILLLMSIKQSIFVRNQQLFHSRSERFVPPIVFPPTAPTRVQLIFGIGIPEEDLAFESLTNGWVLKYEYFLPSNVTQLYVPDRLNIAGRSIPDKNNKNEKYEVEAVQINTGLDESDMDINIKRPVEELNEIRTDFDEMSENRKNEPKQLSKYRWAVYKALEAAVDSKGHSGRTCVLQSICEAARTPFHYQNGIFAEVLQIILTPSASVDEISSHSDNEYFQAEVLGKSGAPCDKIFNECKRSLMDFFTNVAEIRI